MKVLFAGGGTAGHVFPAIAAADVVRRAHGAEVVFTGAADGPEAELFPAAGYRFVPQQVSSAQTRLSLRSVGALAQALVASHELRSFVGRADVVVGIGGYASAPAVLAARRTRTPLVLVEQNAVPGLVNRIAARWARVVATSFDATISRLPARTRVERTGNPVRASIRRAAASRGSLLTEARRTFDLREGRTTVGVFGGSRGALHLDTALAAALPFLADRGDLQLIVSTGPAHLQVLTKAVDPGADLLVRPFASIERMDLALAVTDVALARAGSGHIAELAVCGIPAVLVPYPHATENHQEANARELEAAGAAELLLDASLSPETLTRRLLDLVDDPPRRARMAEAARAWARPDADERLAALVIRTAEAR